MRHFGHGEEGAEGAEAPSLKTARRRMEEDEEQYAGYGELECRICMGILREP